MRRIAVRFLFLVLLTTFGASTSLFANPILYTFSGGNNLAGSFILDEETPFANSTDFNGSHFSTLTSSIQSISGTYGLYSFHGTSRLEIFDQPIFFPNGQEAVAPDYWIVRSALSGPLVNGLSVTQLNLFIYTGANLINGASLTPPPHSASPFDFQFSIAFSDGSFDTGPLNGLTSVPETSSLALLVVGFVGITSVKHKLTVMSRS